MSMKNFNDIIGNRTRALPTCSAVPQLTALPLASYSDSYHCIVTVDYICVQSGSYL